MAAIDRRELLARAGGGALLPAAPGDLLEAVLAPEEAEAALSRRVVRALRADVRGPVLLPRTPGYGSARLVYNRRFDGRRPLAVVRPLDVRDVQAVVRWADRFGVRLVPRSGGHSYASYSAASRRVVVDLRRIRGMHVNAGARRATVGPGRGSSTSTRRWRAGASWRQLRDRYRLPLPRARGSSCRPLLRLLAVVGRERGDRGLAGARPRRA